MKYILIVLIYQIKWLPLSKNSVLDLDETAVGIFDRPAWIFIKDSARKINYPAFASHHGHVDAETSTSKCVQLISNLLVW